jgi:hypothetical protein
MWDSKDLDPDRAGRHSRFGHRVPRTADQRISCSYLFAYRSRQRRTSRHSQGQGPRNPTSAKTSQIWGTRPLFKGERAAKIKLRKKRKKRKKGCPILKTIRRTLTRSGAFLANDLRPERGPN